MPIVTDIKQNLKNKNKVSVFADGEFLCSVTAESVAKMRIHVGDQIDNQKLLDTLFESDCNTAFTKAVDNVCKSFKTQSQVQKYLFDKGFSTAVVNNTIQKMKEYRYVDDAEYVRMFANTYQKSKGKKRICFELKQKGVEQEYINLVDELIDDQKEYALALAQKFAKGKEMDAKNVQKLYRHLASKGFDFDVCRYCANCIAEGIDDYEY